MRIIWSCKNDALRVIDICNRFIDLPSSDIWQGISGETITAIFASLAEPVPGQKRVEVAWEEREREVKSNIASLLGKQMLNPSSLISDSAALLVL